jgi:hypothetical protein
MNIQNNPPQLLSRSTFIILAVHSVDGQRQSCSSIQLQLVETNLADCSCIAQLQHNRQHMQTPAQHEPTNTITLGTGALTATAHDNSRQMPYSKPTPAAKQQQQQQKRTRLNHNTLSKQGVAPQSAKPTAQTPHRSHPK